MRKIIIFSFLICLISCNNSHDIKIKENTKNTEECPYDYLEFKYKGHDMVIFNNYNVMHSPECRKCFPRYD